MSGTVCPGWCVAVLLKLASAWPIELAHGSAELLTSVLVILKLRWAGLTVFREKVAIDRGLSTPEIAPIPSA